MLLDAGCLFRSHCWCEFVGSASFLGRPNEFTKGVGGGGYGIDPTDSERTTGMQETSGTTQPIADGESVCVAFVRG